MQHSIILTMFTLAIFLKDNSGTDYTDYTLLHCRSGFQKDGDGPGSEMVEYELLSYMGNTGKY